MAVKKAEQRLEKADGIGDGGERFVAGWFTAIERNKKKKEKKKEKEIHHVSPCSRGKSGRDFKIREEEEEEEEK